MKQQIEVVGLPKRQLDFLWIHEREDATANDEGWVLGAIRLDDVIIQVSDKVVMQAGDPIIPPRG